MPSVDSRASFDTAVRHLFRNLNDPRALRGNLIVRRFFAGEPELARDLHHRSVLQYIRQLVRRGAEACKQADVDAGKEERAARQYTVATLSFLENRAPEEISSLLGLSRRQYFRERADIGRRIAQYIHSYDEPVAAAVEPVFDSVRLEMAQADLRAQIGDDDDAIRMFARVGTSGASIDLRLAALAEVVSLNLTRHDPARAIQTHGEAVRMVSEHRGSSPLAEAHVDRMASDIAWFSGRTMDAMDCVERAISRLTPLQTTESEPAREFYARSLIERGKHSWARGDLRKAIESISEGDRVLRQVNASPFLLTDTAILVARLRDRLATDSAYWRPAGQRLSELTELYERARALGAIAITVRALLALLEYHTHARDDEAVLKTARFVVSVAERQSSTLLCTRCEASVALAQTRNWRESQWMLDRCDSAPHIAPQRNQKNWAKASLYLRAGAYDQALSLAAAPGNAHKLALVTRLHPVAAEAANALGRRNEAVQFAESAVSSAEGFGSAPNLREAYRVAARVTRDDKFRRKAKEVDRALTS